jgi:hypothetical protein
MRAQLLAATLLLALPLPAAAQNITLKTVPVPSGEQFLLFPTERLGMASVNLGADDPVGAPFSNPARRLHSGSMRVFALPTFYGEASNWVGGRSLPLAASFASGRFHGAAALAMQQLNDRGQRFWFADDTGRNIQSAESDNAYLFGSAGVQLGGRTAAGASIFHGDLGAVDGVNMLYGRSAGIEQSGSIVEMRAGLVHSLNPGRTLEATVTRTRLEMTHDVHYVDWRWEPGNPNVAPQMIRWEERNEDHTLSWGSQLRYRHDLDAQSRFGLLLAGTTKNHPKIPNYNIVDIPRDPGNSAVFNVGAGLSRREENATFAMDVLLEPGRSHTWAYADTAIVLPSGARLEPGDKTVDNQFRFLNWSAAVGWEWQGRRLGTQLGLRTRRVAYSLDQHNFLAERRRETRERFTEWSPSWGGHVAFGAAELRYAGRFTTKGWPAMQFFPVGMDQVASPGVDFVVGPTGVVNLPEYRVTTHRFTVSVPFGR